LHVACARAEHRHDPAVQVKLARSRVAYSDAFVTAFVLVRLLVFGIGSAVPRLWFALRGAPQLTSDEQPVGRALQLPPHVGSRARLSRMPDPGSGVM
jgi:hypothetical protein